MSTDLDSLKKPVEKSEPKHDSEPPMPEGLNKLMAYRAHVEEEIRHDERELRRMHDVKLHHLQQCQLICVIDRQIDALMRSARIPAAIEKHPHWQSYTVRDLDKWFDNRFGRNYIDPELLDLLMEYRFDKIGEIMMSIKTGIADSGYGDQYGPTYTCRYCKSIWHVKYECPRIANLLCGTCKGYGHVSKNCTRLLADTSAPAPYVKKPMIGAKVDMVVFPHPMPQPHMHPMPPMHPMTPMHPHMHPLPPPHMHPLPPMHPHYQHPLPPHYLPTQFM